MPPALRATRTSHAATVRASVELGVGVGWEGPGSQPEGIKGPRKGGRPRAQSPGVVVCGTREPAPQTWLTSISPPSALPSFPHNDTREQVLPAGQIVSKYPEVIGTHRPELCTDGQLLS